MSVYNEFEKDLGGLYYEEPEQEGSYEQITRAIPEPIKEVGRVATQAATGFAGVPGSLTRLAETLRPKPTISPSQIDVALAAGHITPEEAEKAYKQIEELKPEQKQQMEQRLAQETRIPQLPTSEELQDVIAPYIGKPKTEVGKKAGEVAELAGTLLFPLGGEFLAPTRALKAATAAKSAKWLSKGLNLSETAGDIAETGTLLLSLYMGQPSVKNLARDLYKSAEESIPEKFLAKIPQYEQKVIDPLSKWARSGLRTATKDKTLALDIVKELEKGIYSGNRVNVSNLPEVIRDINKTIGEVGANSRVGAHLIKAKNQLTNIIKTHPEIPKKFSVPLLKANNLYAGSRGIDKITNFIKKNPKASSAIAGGGSLLLSILPPEIRKSLAPIAAGGAAIAGGAVAKDVLKNLIKNPQFAAAHLQLIKGALDESVPAFVKGVQKIKKLGEKLPIEKDLSGLYYEEPTA